MNTDNDTSLITISYNFLYLTFAAAVTNWVHFANLGLLNNDDDDDDDDDDDPDKN